MYQEGHTSSVGRLRRQADSSLSTVRPRRRGRFSYRRCRESRRSTAAVSTPSVTAKYPSVAAKYHSCVSAAPGRMRCCAALSRQHRTAPRGAHPAPDRPAGVTSHPARSLLVARSDAKISIGATPNSHRAASHAIRLGLPQGAA